MKYGKKLFQNSFAFICFALILSMLLCAVPVYASEEADAEAEEAPAADARVDIVRVVKDTPRGTKLMEDNLKLESVDALNVPDNALHTIEEAKGKYMLEDLYAGEYLNENQISKSLVQKIDSQVLLKPIIKSGDSFVVVTDYVQANTGKDLSVYLQQLIDINPRRTLYFPDGEYIISKSLFTSADGETSVSIQLSDGAVIKAADNWSGKEATMDSLGTRNALICLGQAEPMNDIRNIGHYYSVMGGTLDGNNKADGLSVDSGRESVIRNICIKNAVRGIVVEKGANNVSSDCDFEDITIICNPDDTRTKGMEIIGYDNSFTNIRIYNAQIGIEDTIGAGNLMKSIYITRTKWNKYYDGTVGVNGKVNNWYSQFHVTNYATAYVVTRTSMLWDCTAEWTLPECKKQTAIRTTTMSLPITGLRAYFLDNDGDTALIAGVDKPEKPIVRVETPIFDEALCSGKVYKDYLSAGGVIPLS